MNELEGDEYACLRILGGDALKEDIVLFHEQAQRIIMDDENMRDMVLSVFEQSYLFNTEKYEELYMERKIERLEEDGHMVMPRAKALNEARLEAWMGGWKEGLKEGKKKGLAKGIYKTLQFLLSIGAITDDVADRAKAVLF